MAQLPILLFGEAGGAIRVTAAGGNVEFLSQVCKGHRIVTDPWAEQLTWPQHCWEKITTCGNASALDQAKNNVGGMAGSGYTCDISFSGNTEVPKLCC
jgi:hypothetical protein